MGSDESYRAALEAAEAELDEVLGEYQQLGDRVVRLQQAVRGLRQLVHGDDDADPVAGEVGPNGGRDAEPIPVPNSDSKITFYQWVNGQGFVRPRKPVPGPIGSTDRAVAILEESGEPMRFREIIAEFERRGWVDQTWDSPEAAMRMAVRRAARNRRVHQVAPGLYQAGPPEVQDERHLPARNPLYDGDLYDLTPAHDDTDQEQ